MLPLDLARFLRRFDTRLLFNCSDRSFMRDRFLGLLLAPV
jgi:hypothetical protein